MCINFLNDTVNVLYLSVFDCTWNQFFKWVWIFVIFKNVSILLHLSMAYTNLRIKKHAKKNTQPDALNCYNILLWINKKEYLICIKLLPPIFNRYVTETLLKGMSPEDIKKLQVQIKSKFFIQFFIFLLLLLIIKENRSSTLSISSAFINW